MAQRYVTTSGTLVIPGAYSSYTVQNANSGLATSGVLFLIGEAEQGMSFSEETDLSENAFGPDQLGDVVAKYKSGPLVDAFRMACAPANDPAVTGSFSRAVLVKTNTPTRASSALLRYDSSAFCTIQDIGGGALGNNIYYTVSAAQAEVEPTTGSFTWIPTFGNASLRTMCNGVQTGAATLNTPTTPADFQTAVNALVGVTCSGGAARTLGIAGPQTLTLTVVSGAAVTITYSGVWTQTPVAGDTLIVKAGAGAAGAFADPAGGATNDNVGAYVVTSVSAGGVVSCTKLSNVGSGGSATPIVAPRNTGAVTVNAADDITVFAPVTISVDAGDPLDGYAKSLEIFDNAGTESIEEGCYILGTATKVGWISTVASPYLLTGTEYIASLNINRQFDSISESIIGGGDIVMKIGYTNGAASAAVLSVTTAGYLTTTVTGVMGADLSVQLSQYPTIADLVAYINSQSGYSCVVGTAALGQRDPTNLDVVTSIGILAKRTGVRPGLLKQDLWDFTEALSESATVELKSTATTATAGLPKVVATNTWLSGGAKGATTNTLVTNALTAIESVPGNFVVPLFSRDASYDITDGLTDSASTYTISSINAAAKSHVLAVSTLKRRKNRQAFCSFRGSFANAKEAAANLASFRCAMDFQDVKALDSTGTVYQFQPWMGAVQAAAMQAAGFYKAMVNKIPNISGALQAAGDFSDQTDSQLEDALLTGLNPFKRDMAGVWRRASDQTTYSKDDNFVYNSIQAVYVGDVIALSTAQRMEAAFVGESVADVSAVLALNYLESIMSDFLRLKLIAPSSDAPKGFKNASVRIIGPVMLVTCEVKLAGAIYFIPISFQISMVTQSA